MHVRLLDASIEPLNRLDPVITKFVINGISAYEHDIDPQEQQEAQLSAEKALI